MPIDIPDIPGLPSLGFVPDFISGLLGGFFRTHRPDVTDLPAGTHWLYDDVSAGVIWMYTHEGVWQFPWVGEVIATIEDNFPVANWSYHFQEIMPLAGVSRDGACHFIRADLYDNGTAHQWDLIRERVEIQVGYDFIANQKAREQHANNRKVVEDRGMSWADMVNQMQRIAASANAHGVHGGYTLGQKLISPEWYDLQRMKVFG